MDDMYDVTVARTGRIWRRVVLTWYPAMTRIPVEMGSWRVPGRRWAHSKAWRVHEHAYRSTSEAGRG
jgi:hypothetical protein